MTSMTGVEGSSGLGVGRALGAAAPGHPAEDEALASEPAGRRREDRIVGASEATRRLIAQASEAARTQLPVWLSGPPGSDRELVARAIHTWSRRTTEPMEVLRCAAIPEALQGRELFGCAEGVYPAVPGAYAGALQRAASSTLFLDQIEELRSDTRTQLLDAIGEGDFRREGDARSQQLTVRLILGTERRDAPPLVQPFHAIQIRPLAERPEDVLPLAAHYLRAFSEEAGLRPLGFTADARACLQAEVWPGDVQELRERVRQAVRLAGDGAISAEALMLAKDSEQVPSFKEAKRAFETRYVEGLLRRCGGNISRAARLAKKDRKDFYDVIRRTGIDPAVFRG